MLFFVFRLQEIIIRFIVVIQAFGGNSPDFVFVIFKQMGYIVVEVFFQFVSVKTSYAGACTYPHISFFMAHGQASYGGSLAVLDIDDLLDSILLHFCSLKRKG